MNERTVLTAMAVCLSFAAACSGGGGGGLPCDDDRPCPDGFSCDKNGACVQVDKLRISTEALDPAAVGVPYQFKVNAEGGLPPYHGWEVESELGWLSIDAQSGILQGTPDKGTLGAAITVGVLDSSWGDGDKTSRTFQLTVLDCTQEGLLMECFESDGEICAVGERTCRNSLWTACVHKGSSQDINHCGPECSACDRRVADRCLGVCQCGSQPACSANLRCCLAVCLDTSTSMRHCGECGNECSEQTVQNATGISCQNGQCNYVACKEGFLDCDSNRSNGCESAIDTAHCGNCETDCNTLVKGAEMAMCVSAGPGVFRCDYDVCAKEYADCDRIRRNGCETWLGAPQSCGGCAINCLAQGSNRACLKSGDEFVCGCNSANDCADPGKEQCCRSICWPLGDNSACGSCDNDCSQSPYGPLCIDPEHAQCGCFSRFDCATKELCCANTCVAIDDSHCGDCSIVCSPVYGGPHCDSYSEHCYCQSNAECQGFGSGICQGTGTDARCR